MEHSTVENPVRTTMLVNPAESFGQTWDFGFDIRQLNDFI